MAIRGIILDIDGTELIGDRMLDGAPEALTILRQLGYRLVFCTQQTSTRIERTLSERLRAVGVLAARGPFGWYGGCECDSWEAPWLSGLRCWKRLSS